jgi:signal transduction histidine kinase
MAVSARGGAYDTHVERHAGLLHQGVLGEHLYLSCWIRYIVAAGMVSGGLLGKYVVGFEQLLLGGIVVVAVVLAVANSLVLALVAPRRALAAAREHKRLLIALHHVVVVLDFLALTVALWIVGGTGSPFQATYLLHVILSSMLLSRRAAWSHTVVGYALFAALVAGEYTRLLPCPHPFQPGVEEAHHDLNQALMNLGVQGLLMGLTVFLVTGLVHRLREGERRLQRAHDELSSLSTLRRDFLHIVLHDLKSPIGAVRSILSAMASGYGGPVTEDQKEWLRRCLDRLSGLSRFLRDLGVLAELDARALRENASPVDLGVVVRSLVKENEDLARVRAQTITAEVEPRLPLVRGQERLLREAILNYITNAIRYTPMGRAIVVRALRSEGGVRVEVEDEGIGVEREEQPKLFQEFARLKKPGEAGEKGKVTSSGLGLSIVRRIVELHGGRVGCESTPGEGSTFYLEIPEPPR